MIYTIVYNMNKHTSYAPNLIVEYVSWRSKEALNPLYKAKIPCLCIIDVVNRTIDILPSCCVCKWTYKYSVYK